MDEQPLQQQPQQAAMAMLMDMDDDVTDPSDWPTASGAQLDQLMRCTICRDFFGAPVMFVGCSHTFCSLCIRRALEYERVCPQCRQPSEPTQLKSNRIVESIVAQYAAMRPGMLRLVRAQQAPAAEATAEAPARRSRAQAAPSPAAEPVPVSEPAPTPLEKDEVMCPMCQAVVKLTSINDHIDSDCKKHVVVRKSPPATPAVPTATNTIVRLASNDSSSAKATAPRRPLAKLAYDVLKDAQLRKFLKDYNLKTTGERQSLVWRLNEYILRYNASCDSLKPQSPAQIVREIDEEEDRRRTNSATIPRSPSGPSRSGSGGGSSSGSGGGGGGALDQNDIDANNSRYVRSNQKDFDALIEQARAKIGSKKPSLSAAISPSPPPQAEEIKTQPSSAPSGSSSSLPKHMADGDDDDDFVSSIADSEIRAMDLSSPPLSPKRTRRKRSAIGERSDEGGAQQPQPEQMSPLLTAIAAATTATTSAAASQHSSSYIIDDDVLVLSESMDEDDATSPIVAVHPSTPTGKAAKGSSSRRQSKRLKSQA